MLKWSYVLSDARVTDEKQQATKQSGIPISAYQVKTMYNDSLDGRQS